ncbi:hypothetical protein D6D21_07238 [Aureobasidium pullulans]|uniref:ATPase inhibitor, mitochondrial n=2 Tax=Aureobasidium pullulans TaxID=5580 RepID=A0A4S8XHS4_AURPU|nr:hypothetical protein D6D22_06816 [Aureobasidium pullulans]THW39592.1 hypothetical protein D6D21_07238 [Aureobasidium pullulans]
MYSDKTRMDWLRSFLFDGGACSYFVSLFLPTIPSFYIIADLAQIHIMSSALRIARVARPAVANVQVARFSIASRMMAAGDTGATRSGGAASGDAFSKREDASENLYVKRHEQEKLEQLRQKVKAGEAQLAKDKADLDKAQK